MSSVFYCSALIFALNITSNVPIPNLLIFCDLKRNMVNIVNVFRFCAEVKVFIPTLNRFCLLSEIAFKVQYTYLFKEDAYLFTLDGNGISLLVVSDSLQYHSH